MGRKGLTGAGVGVSGLGAGAASTKDATIRSPGHGMASASQELRRAAKELIAILVTAASFH